MTPKTLLDSDVLSAVFRGHPMATHAAADYLLHDLQFTLALQVKRKGGDEDASLDVWQESGDASFRIVPGCVHGLARRPRTG